MSDISATEQRLSAALDRIDRGIGRLRGAAHEGARDGAAGAPDTPAVAELHYGQEAAIRQRLVSAGAEAARLAAANDQLIAANRALMDAADPAAFADASLAAQSAEIEALRAARDAELAQMGDVLASLEAMLGVAGERAMDAPSPAGFDEDLSPVEPEGQIVRFGRSDAAAEDTAAATDDHEDEKG